MSRQHLIGMVLGTVVCLLGCEDIITVDLKDAEPKLVIEGYIGFERGVSYILLTRTTNYADTGEISGVTGAFVTVSTVYHTILYADTLTEDSLVTGRYRFHRSHLPFVFGLVFHASVTVDGKTYEAESTAQPYIRIDSLTSTYYDGRTDFGGVEGYQVHVHFLDPAGSTTYLLITEIGRASGKSKYPYTYNGTYSDGRAVDFALPYFVVPKGEQVEVDIENIDRSIYDYYVSLQKDIAYDLFTGMGIRNVTPTNPVSNWSNGALGYFGVFTGSSRTIIVGQ